VGIYSTKAKWQRFLQPAVDFCVRRSIHPDWFTYSALGVSLTAAVALWLARFDKDWLWVVPPCILLRLLLNLMDGQVARSLGVADMWGEAKNEFGDRVADASLFAALGLAGYARPSLALIAVVSILGASYLGILGKALGGQRLYGGIFGKGDRMIALALFTLYPAASGNLASYDLFLSLASAGALITIIQRLKIIHDRS
jgi:CDP-diacylglycerol--glycerol-3-phosphate 3-phosphatidyltransferase